MAWTYDELIAKRYEEYASAEESRFALNEEKMFALLDWNNNQDHAAIKHCINCLFYISAALNYMSDGAEYGYNGYDYTMMAALDRSKAFPTADPPDPDEDPMGTLINTMLTAKPEQVEYFVGLVDAYRQSVWNRPFNAEFFAALARGFEIWE